MLWAYNTLINDCWAIHKVPSLLLSSSSIKWASRRCHAHGRPSMGAPLGKQGAYHEFLTDLSGEKTKHTVMES